MIWWSRIGKVEEKNLLQSLQNSYLRATVETMKTTYRSARNCTLSVSSGSCYNQCSQKHGVQTKMSGRMERLRTRSNTKLGFFQNNSFILKQDRTLRRYQLKHFKIWIPTRKDWIDLNKTTNTNVDFWFTDGSSINRFSAGIYEPKDNYMESIPMGSHFTIFWNYGYPEVQNVSWPKTEKEKHIYLLEQQGSYTSASKDKASKDNVSDGKMKWTQ